MGLGPDFYKKLVQVSSNVGMAPEDILNVMAVESGLNPSAHNRNGNASGLVQFMPSTLKNIGFRGNHSDFRDLGAVAQLDWVEKLIRNQMKMNGGPFTSAAQYYVGNFIPAALKIPGVRKRDPNAIICSKNPTIAHIPNVTKEKEAKFYAANQGLDFDKDGNITYGDIEKVLKSKSAGKVYKGAVADLQKYTGYKPMSKPNSTQPKSNLNSILDNFLRLVAASEKDINKLYKKHLPYHHSVIEVKSNNFTDKVEFAKVLSEVLSEELLAKAYTHVQNDKVEVECSIPGPKVECLKIANELIQEVKEEFVNKTNIVVDCNLVWDKKSSYQPIEFKVADLEHRKFIVKMIQG